MIAIIINHLAWGPSLYSFITGESSLLASAAEGFFAISGILIGYIYGPRILSQTKEIFQKLFKRAFILWALATFFTFFYTAWATLSPDSAKFETVYDLGFVKFLYNTLLLRYGFGWTDFLTRYALFMVAAPFVLWVIAKGKSWLVAIVSVLVWATLRETDFFLPFSAWQLVFFIGIVIGYYLPAIEKTVRGWPKKIQKASYITLISTFLLTYIVSVLAVVALPLLSSSFPEFADLSVVRYINSLYLSVLPYFDKATLDPARILIGTVWFTALYVIFRRHEDTINRATRGTLLMFGRNSLFVYCLHAFILFIVDLYFLPSMFGFSSLAVNTIVASCVLAFIYYITKYRIIFTRAKHMILPSTRPKSAPVTVNK